MFEGKPVFAPRYWLDLGNKKSDGQVILGQPPECSYNAVRYGQMNSRDFARYGINAPTQQIQARLPTVVEMFPELLDASVAEDDMPTCSVADALSKQSMFINDMVSDWAMQLLDDLLRGDGLRFCGVFINLETGRVNPLPVPVPVPVPQSVEMARRAVA